MKTQFDKWYVDYCSRHPELESLHGFGDDKKAWAAWQAAHAEVSALKDELLEALTELLHKIDLPQQGMGLSALIHQARVAVSKAKQAPTSYDRKRIAWELERTAMGDGHYGSPQPAPSAEARAKLTVAGLCRGVPRR